MAEGAINIEPEGNESRVPINRENVVFKSGGGGAVESVNGKTGNVILTTSDLRNTSGYQTRTDVMDAIGVEELARQNADADLQGQITSLSNTKADKSTTYTKTETDGLLSAKQDKLTAGTNITIDANNVISASGGGATYTAGNGIDITSNVISADTTLLATKTDLSSKQDNLTAGSNIQINNNTISATDTTYSAGTGLDLTDTTFSADTTVLATKADLSGKQDTLTAGTNVTISDNTISATDTTYSDFTGTDGQTAGSAGLVPAPATTDAGKFLKADGTWDTAGGGGGGFDPYSETRTRSDVYVPNGPNYNAYYSSVYINPYSLSSPSDIQNRSVNILGVASYYAQTVQVGYQASVYGSDGIAIGDADAAKESVAIGPGAGSAGSTESVFIGKGAGNNGSYSVIIGHSAQGSNAYGATAVGKNAKAGTYSYGVALGMNSKVQRASEVSVGSDDANFSPATRYVANVTDPSLPQDAATKNYVDQAIIRSGTAAPTSATAGSVGALYAYVESGAGHLAICTDDTGGTYTWQTLI